MICYFTFEEVWNVDLVLMVLVISMGEDVGALEELWTEAKDVIDEEDCGGRAGGAGGI